MDYSTPVFSVLHHLLDLGQTAQVLAQQTHVCWVSDTIRCPLLLLSSVFPSISFFSNELTLCIRWPNYWSFSFSISPFQWISGLISFRIDWLDLLQFKGFSRVFSNTTFQSINSLAFSLPYGPILTSLHDNSSLLPLRWAKGKVWGC